MLIDMINGCIYAYLCVFMCIYVLLCVYTCINDVLR